MDVSHFDEHGISREVVGIKYDHSVFKCRIHIRFRTVISDIVDLDNLVTGNYFIKRNSNFCSAVFECCARNGYFDNEFGIFDSEVFGIDFRRNGDSVFILADSGNGVFIEHDNEFAGIHFDIDALLTCLFKEVGYVLTFFGNLFFINDCAVFGHNRNVRERSDVTSLRCATNGTGAGFFAPDSDLRFFGDYPVAVSMIGEREFFYGFVITMRAGDFNVTVLFASGIGNFFDKVVTESGAGNVFGVDGDFAVLVDKHTPAYRALIMRYVAALFAGGVFGFYKDDGVGVTRQRNVTRFFLVANGTFSFFNAFFGFGRRFGYSPFAPGVTELGNIENIQFFATDRTKEMFATFLGASWLYNDLPFVRLGVSDHREFFYFDFFSANGTYFMSGTRFDTGGLFGNLPFAYSVTDSIDLFHYFFAATGANLVLTTLFGAGRKIRDDPIAKGVSNSVDLFRFDLVTNRANSFPSAFFGAGRLSDNFPIAKGMFNQVDFFRFE